jgi:hypothetical protein
MAEITNPSGDAIMYPSSVKILMTKTVVDGEQSMRLCDQIYETSCDRIVSLCVEKKRKESPSSTNFGSLRSRMGNKRKCRSLTL